MSELTNEIVLRPRFQLNLKTDIDHLKQTFDQSSKDPFLIKRLDEHVYIRFKKIGNHFLVSPITFRVDVL